MRDDHASAIAALGAVITPELVDATQRLYAPLHTSGGPAGLAVTRDLTYGPDERNRLDVFTTDASGARPVLVSIHGGGFVRGDKSLPGTPYYDNVGRWAATNGFVGVTMTYRFAPAHTYPACAVDIANAMRWLHANVARFGGDPHAIVLVGQSAGAAHAAMYAARPPAFHAQGMQLADALFARHGRFPNMLYLSGHNHISQVVHLGAEGADDPLLGIRLAEFVAGANPRANFRARSCQTDLFPAGA
jgi:acetyl esterase/lipase